MEKSHGSLDIGKKANLIILDKNIFEIEKKLIHKCKVLETRLKEVETRQTKYKQTILDLKTVLTKIKLLSDHYLN